MPKALTAALAFALATLTACGNPPADPAPATPSPAHPVANPKPTTTRPLPTSHVSSTPPSTPPTSYPPSSTPPSPKPKPATPPLEDSNAGVGPFGWQTLHLGMSPARAEALGVATPTPEGDDLCQVWPASPASALDRVIVHPTHGVFAIHPKTADWLHTPEGMRTGWTTTQVAAAYPDFTPAHRDHAHGPTVAVPGNPDAVYRMRFTESGVLTRFFLERNTDICSV